MLKFIVTKMTCRNNCFVRYNVNSKESKKVGKVKMLAIFVYIPAVFSRDFLLFSKLFCSRSKSF